MPLARSQHSRGSSDSGHISDAPQMLSRSYPGESVLSWPSGSPKAPAGWKLKDSIKAWVSPKRRVAPLPQSQDEPDVFVTSSGDEGDSSSSPTSVLPPSLKRSSKITESPIIQHLVPSKASSVLSDSVSTEYSTIGGLATDSSKHRLQKVESTRACVLDTVRRISDGALDATHGALRILDGVLPYGLDGITRLLLNIWDAVQEVKTNQEECLTLVRRCATILSALYEDIERELSPAAKEQIQIPKERLDHAFTKIFDVARKLQEHSRIKQFFMSEEILKEIDDCHQALDDCLRTFGTSILLRIFDSVQDMRSPGLQGSRSLPLPQGSPDPAQESPDPAHENSLDELLGADLKNFSGSQSDYDVENMSAEEIREAIRKLQSEQNRRDRERDIKELKRRVRKATRSKTWPNASDSSGQHASRHMADARSAAAVEVPLSDVLLLHMVGHGPISRVYKGVLRNEFVAVKIYAGSGLGGPHQAKAKDFISNEIEIWSKLNHPNVLEFRSRGMTEKGADGMRVEFVISPFLPHGNVSSYMKQMQWNYHGMPGRPERLDERRIFLDTAKGMEYLHSNKISHGNLKASNVLVNSQMNCVISDFKYSEEHTRRWGGDVYYGIRWQAPEVLRSRSTLRETVDVYAYAIFCTEVLNFGEIPWPHSSDNEIRESVLVKDQRPEFPMAEAARLGILQVMQQCWDSSPDLRPRFRRVVKVLRREYESLN